MTKGPGRSDCCRVGVTYGYRECLRKGRVRAGKAASQVRRPIRFDELALSFICAKLDPERLSSPFSRRHCVCKYYAVFPDDRISTKNPLDQ